MRTADGFALGHTFLVFQFRLRRQHANLWMAIVCFFAEQALSCPHSRVALPLTMPEDFGGHLQDGPASQWCSSMLRNLQGVGDARRSAGILCQLAAADSMRPTVFLSNVTSWTWDLYFGFPQPQQHGNFLEYAGPLPQQCPCPRPHSSASGASKDLDAVTAMSRLFVLHFGLESSLDFAQRRNETPLRMGEGPRERVSQQWFLLVFSSLY